MPADEKAESLAALGRSVRALRTAAGLSQERLAEGAGLAARYVSDVERGRRNVGFVNLERIARAMGVRLSELADRYEDERGG